MFMPKIRDSMSMEMTAIVRVGNISVVRMRKHLISMMKAVMNF